MAATRELPLWHVPYVMFPTMPVELRTFDERYKLLIDRCQKAATPFGMVAIRRPHHTRGPAEAFDVGTSAYVGSVERKDNGHISLKSSGYQRFKVLDFHDKEPYLTAIVEDFPVDTTLSPVGEKLMQAVRHGLLRHIAKVTVVLDLPFALEVLPDRIDALVYLAATVLEVPESHRQSLLSQPDADTMVKYLYNWLKREKPMVRLMEYNEERWSELPGVFSAN